MSSIEEELKQMQDELDWKMFWTLDPDRAKPLMGKEDEAECDAAIGRIKKRLGKRR